MGQISYAFGRDYLSNWTLTDALREVFQNYLDYGNYVVNDKETDTNTIRVMIGNNYIPENLEFMRIGNSSKRNGGDYIGYHGEGLKAAFLVFAREGLPFEIQTNKYILTPKFEQTEIGEVLAVEYTEMDWHHSQFTTVFDCPADIYKDFIDNIVNGSDIIHVNLEYGDLLNPETKGTGNIYCGRLFVCHDKSLNYSYNIRPKQLNLDRDRRVPRDFDVEYATSKILESWFRQQNSDAPEITVADYNAKDMSYVNALPENIDNIKAVTIGGKVKYYDKVSDTVINNSNITKILDNHPKFKKVKEESYRNKLNTTIRIVAKKSTLRLLREFKENHCRDYNKMILDIDVIIARFKNKK
jgi:hypothetical protein